MMTRREMAEAALGMQSGTIVAESSVPMSRRAMAEAALGVAPTQSGASPAQVDSNSLPQPITGMQMPQDGVVWGTVKDAAKAAVDAGMGRAQGIANYIPEAVRLFGEAQSNVIANTPGLTSLRDPMQDGAPARLVYDGANIMANALGNVTSPIANTLGGLRAAGQIGNPMSGGGLLQASPQAQAGLASMQSGETLLPTTPQGFGALAGGLAPEINVGLATGLAGGGATLGGMLTGLASAGGTMESKVAENIAKGMPRNLALAAAAESATASGVLEAATARMPLEEAFNAGKLAALSGIRGAAVGVGRSAVAEGIQEGTTEAGQMIEERLRTGDATATDGMGRRVLQASALGAVVGGGMAGGMAGAGAAAERLARPVAINNASQPVSQSPSQSANVAGSQNQAPLEGQNTNADVDPSIPMTDAEEFAALQDAIYGFGDAIDAPIRERQAQVGAQVEAQAATEPAQPSQVAGVSSPSPVEPSINSEPLGVQDGQTSQTIGEQVDQTEASLPAQAQPVVPAQETASDARGESVLPAEQAAQAMPARGTDGQAKPPIGDVGNVDRGASRPVEPARADDANLPVTENARVGDNQNAGVQPSQPDQNQRVDSGARADVADAVVARDLASIQRATESTVTIAPAKGKRQAAVSRRMKELGVRTVFLKDSSGKFDGVAGGVKGDRVVYLREDLDEKEIAPVALHEFGHTMRRENADLHRELVEVAGDARLEEAANRYREKLVAKFGEDSPNVRRLDEDADFREDEAVGQLLQDLASEDSDIADLIVERPGLMKKLKDWVRKMAASLGASTGPAKDWKLREAVVRVVTEAEKRADAKAVKKTSWAKTVEGVRAYARERAAAMPRSQAGAMMVDELEGRMRADNETGGELQGMSQFTGSFSKPLKAYPDLKLALQGQSKAVRDMFTFNQKGGMGADLMSSIGADKMVEIARRKVLGAKSANNADEAMRALAKSDNPDDVIVARIAERADGKRPMPKSFIRPSELAPGDVLSIFGEQSVIGEYESGGLVGVGGVLDGLDIAPGMNPIPMDGPMTRAEAPMLQREEGGGFDGDLPFSPGSSFPETIDVDGVQRPTRMADRQKIATRIEDVRQFWQWLSAKQSIADFTGPPRKELVREFHAQRTRKEEQDRAVRMRETEPQRTLMLKEKIANLVDPWLGMPSRWQSAKTQLQKEVGLVTIAMPTESEQSVRRELRRFMRDALATRLIRDGWKLDYRSSTDSTYLTNAKGTRLRISDHNLGFADFGTRKQVHKGPEYVANSNHAPERSMELIQQAVDDFEGNDADNDNPDIRFSPSDKGVGEPAIPAGDSRAARAVGRIMDKAKGAANALRLERTMNKRVEKQAGKELSALERAAAAEVLRVGKRGVTAAKQARNAKQKLEAAKKELLDVGKILRNEMGRNERLGKAAVAEVVRMGKNAMKDSARAKATDAAREELKQVTKILRDEMKGRIENAKKLDAFKDAAAREKAREAEKREMDAADDAMRLIADATQIRQDKKTGEWSVDDLAVTDPSMKSEVIKLYTEAKNLREDITKLRQPVAARPSASSLAGGVPLVRKSAVDEAATQASREAMRRRQERYVEVVNDLSQIVLPVTEKDRSRQAREIRARMYSLAKQLPAEVRGELLKPMRDAKDTASLFAAWIRVDEAMGDYEMKRADKSLSRIAKRSELAFLGPDVRKEVEADIAKARQMRRGITDTRTQVLDAANKVDREASNQARRDRRAAQAAYVKAVQDVTSKFVGERIQNRMMKAMFGASIEDLQDNLRAAVVARKEPLPKQVVTVLEEDGTKTKTTGIEISPEGIARSLSMVEASMVTIATELDGSRDGLLNTVIEKVKQSEAQASDDVNAANLRIAKAAQKAGYKSLRDLAVRFGGAAGEANVRKVKVRVMRADGAEDTLGMPIHRAMHLYAMLKESDAGKKLEAGTRFTFQDGITKYVYDNALADRLENAMGERHIALYRELQQIAQVNARAANAARMAATGKSMEFIDNYVKTSRDGVYRNASDKDSLASAPISDSGPVLTNMPWMQPRVASTNTPYRVMNYWEAVQATIQEQATVAHVALPLLAVERAMMSGPAASAIEKRYGSRVRKTVRRYIQAVGGANPVRSKLDEWAVEINRKKARGITTSLRNFAMNLGSMARVLGEVEAADWAKGMSGARLRVVDELLSKSAIARERMRQRYATLQTGTTSADSAFVTEEGMNRPPVVDIRMLFSAVAETARSVGSGRFKDAYFRNLSDVADFQRVPMYIDAFVMGHLWQAKKSEAARKGLTGTEADAYVLKEFERSLPNVMSSHNAADLGGVKLATRNGATSLAFNFLSEPSSMWQQWHQAWATRKQPGGQARLRRVVAGFIGNAMWSGLMQVIVRRRTITTIGAGWFPLVVLGLIRPSGDDEEKEARAAREAALSRITDVVPGAVGSTVTNLAKSPATNAIRNLLGPDQDLLRKQGTFMPSAEGGLLYASLGSLGRSINDLSMALSKSNVENRAERIGEIIARAVKEAGSNAGQWRDPFDVLEELFAADDK